MHQEAYTDYLNQLMEWGEKIEREHRDLNAITKDEILVMQRLETLMQDIQRVINMQVPITEQKVMLFHKEANIIYKTIQSHTYTHIENHYDTENSLYVPMASNYFKQPDPQVKNTFQALVNTMIPSSREPVDYQMDLYLIMLLDNYVSMQKEWTSTVFHLSTPTAKMLDIAAEQLMALKTTQHRKYTLTEAKSGYFAALSDEERVEAVHLLETLQIDLYTLPNPYFNNGSFVKSIITYAFQFVKFGFYSEWIAYGSTRFSPPEERRFENRPYSWDRVGYPGVSNGYRALRGFLVDEFTEKVE